MGFSMTGWDAERNPFQSGRCVCRSFRQTGSGQGEDSPHRVSVSQRIVSLSPAKGHRRLPDSISVQPAWPEVRTAEQEGKSHPQSPWRRGFLLWPGRSEISPLTLSLVFRTEQEKTMMNPPFCPFCPFCPDFVRILSGFCPEQKSLFFNVSWILSFCPAPGALLHIHVYVRIYCPVNR